MWVYIEFRYFDGKQVVAGVYKTAQAAARAIVGLHPEEKFGFDFLFGQLKDYGYAKQLKQDNTVLAEVGEWEVWE